MRKIPSIDLHGKTQEEVFDLLDSFLRKNANQALVLIIVGKGKGLVKKKTLEYLKQARYSWKYEKVKGFINEGALLVEMS